MERDIMVWAQKVWQWLKPPLPERPAAPKGGRPWVDNQKCLLGMVWELKTGARWRDIPKDLGVSASSCWRRHVQWSGEGLFEAAWAAVLAQAQKRRPAAGREPVVDGMLVREKKGAKTLARPSVARG
jgi:transposase